MYILKETGEPNILSTKDLVNYILTTKVNDPEVYEFIRQLRIKLDEFYTLVETELQYSDLPCSHIFLDKHCRLCHMADNLFHNKDCPIAVVLGEDTIDYHGASVVE